MASDPGFPTFSVLMPTYNQEAYLPAALDSLLAQSFKDWEVLVVNDGSRDGTQQVIEAYAARDPRIRAFRQENGGTAVALNEGLRRARGAWVTWLSSDDLYEPDALEVFARGIREIPEARFFHSSFSYLMHETGELRPQPDSHAESLPAPGLETMAHFEMNYLNGITVCIQRSLLEDVGDFNPDYRWGHDADLWLRISARTRLHFLNHRTGITRLHVEQSGAAFPQAGWFDGARSCLAFLNGHSFPELFPNLDLRNPRDIQAAVQESLRVTLNSGTFLHFGVGPHPALLERLGEWLAKDCPPEVAHALRLALGALVAKTRDLAPPQAEALQRISRGEPIRYVARDPLVLMRENLEALERQNRVLAGQVRRYLGLVEGRALGSPAARAEAKAPARPKPVVGLAELAPPPVPEAFLFEPDFQGGEGREVVLSYLKAFAPGEPVILILFLDPAQEGLPSLETAQMKVLEWAVEAGLQTFPDIAVVDRPEELLDLLSSHPHAQWIPRSPGDTRGLQGPLGWRLAQARKALTGRRTA